MKTIVICLCCTLLLLQCKKEESGFGEVGVIKGKILIKDSLSDRNIPASNGDVYIGFGKTPDRTYYDYKIKADVNGKFELSYLSATGSYTMFAVYSVNGVKYELTSKIQIDDGEKEFVLEKKDELVFLKGQILIKDTLSDGQIPIANVNVFLGYKSIPTYSDYSFKLLSDKNGYFFSPKIDTNSFKDYQLLAEKSIFIGGHMISFKRYLSFSDFNKVKNTMEVVPSDSVGYTSIKFISTANTPQPNVYIYLFANKLSFLNSKNGSGSFFNSVTNYKGLTYLSGLTVNSNYYFKAYQIAGQDTTILNDSLIIPNNRYPKFTFILK
jgi:hypothetical protein